MAKKKKRGKKTSGHYCRICGEHKPNEKFSGKGHAKHICKECDALPQERKNELQYINQIDQAAWKYPRSKQDWELLERFAKNKKYPEAMEYAQSILDTNRDQQFEEEIDFEEDDFDIEELIWDSLNFSELEEDLKEDISFELYEVIENP